MGHVGSRRFGIGTLGSIDFVAQEVDLAGVRAHGAVAGDNVVPVERASVLVLVRVYKLWVDDVIVPSQTFTFIVGRKAPVAVTAVLDTAESLFVDALQGEYHFVATLVGSLEQLFVGIGSVCI